MAERLDAERHKAWLDPENDRTGAEQVTSQKPQLGWQRSHLTSQPSFFNFELAKSICQVVWRVSTKEKFFACNLS